MRNRSFASGECSNVVLVVNIGHFSIDDVTVLNRTSVSWVCDFVNVRNLILVVDVTVIFIDVLHIPWTRNSIGSSAYALSRRRSIKNKKCSTTTQIKKTNTYVGGESASGFVRLVFGLSDNKNVKLKQERVTYVTITVCRSFDRTALADMFKLDKKALHKYTETIV